jgi:hypothetical protein
VLPSSEFFSSTRIWIVSLVCALAYLVNWFAIASISLLFGIGRLKLPSNQQKEHLLSFGNLNFGKK